jgi:hypothetical protein
VLRAQVVDGVRLFGRRAAEERRAVDHGVRALHRCRERARVEQVALDELDMMFAQRSRAPGVAHERTDLMAALGEPFGEPTSDLSGRSGDEDLHARSVSIGVRRGLEETDKRMADLARVRRARSQLADARERRSPRPRPA